ncbi:MAG: hypothetical protein Q8L29_01645 [archaeon]|nr:hypothetical protein [archaeon]
MPINQELRTKGKNLLKQGFALIDESGRPREIKEKNSVALASKNFKFTILFLSSDKKEILKKLEERHSKNKVPVIMHSVALYYAIESCIHFIPGIFICHDGCDKNLLKHYLKNFLREKYNEGKIKIEDSLVPMFGKKNIADKLAKKIIRSVESVDIQLKEKHFKKLGLLK